MSEMFAAVHFFALLVSLSAIIGVLLFLRNWFFRRSYNPFVLVVGSTCLVSLFFGLIMATLMSLLPGKLYTLALDDGVAVAAAILGGLFINLLMFGFKIRPADVDPGFFVAVDDDVDYGKDTYVGETPLLKYLKGLDPNDEPLPDPR